MSTIKGTLLLLVATMGLIAILIAMYGTSLTSTNARSVEEIAAAVEHLAKLSEGLNRTLSVFKTA